MKVDLLAVRNAKSHVESYTNASHDLMARHAEAMDCRDCEAFLQMGIDAFEWLIRADRVIRLSTYRDDTEFDAVAESAIARLCEEWLKPVAFAERWIEIQQRNGYEIDNCELFRNCVAEMSAIVGASSERIETIAGPVASLRDEAVREHRDGQTSEFV